MEGLDLLCVCCKNIQCNKNQFKITNQDNCKVIKCLQFVKDDSKIVPYEKFDFNIRSDSNRKF